MNGLNCVLCDNSIEADKFDLKKETTLQSFTLLLNFLEYVIGEQFISNDNYNICFPCYQLLNEFEELEYKAKEVKNHLLKLYENYKQKCKDNINGVTGLPLTSELPLEDISKNVNNRHVEVDCSSFVKEELNDPKDDLQWGFCHKTFVSKNCLENHIKKQDFIDDKQDATKDVKIFEDGVVTENLTKNIENVQPDKACLVDDINRGDIKNNLVSVTKFDNGGSDNKGTAEKKKGRKKKDLDSAKFYECNDCHKKWKTVSDLKTHMARHSKIKPFICEICGQAYKHKTALDVHVGMHNGINPHTCEYCNKSFTQKGGLIRHLPIHTGEMHHQCDLCGKRFIHHTSFNIHRLSHSGEKAYKCNVCGLALMSGSHLKRHMRGHTGEKNYSCNICGKRFAEKYNLATHEKLHNSTIVTAQKRKYRCQMCPNSFSRKTQLEEHVSNEHQNLLSESKAAVNVKLDDFSVLQQQNNYVPDFDKSNTTTSINKIDTVTSETSTFIEALQMESQYLKSLHIYTDNDI